MQICIAGWYFDKDLLKLMIKVNDRHPVTIVAHRNGDSQGLPCEVIENIGLEFHMYNYFLMNLWDGKSNILFMHDDLKIMPVMVNNEIIPATNIFNKIADIKADQGYLFQDENDGLWNAWKHGRMICMSARLADQAKRDGGFRYDSDNIGQTRSGPYNAGIVWFHDMMENYRRYFDTCGIFFVPAITFLRRAGAVPNTLDAKVA
jgi:hypothetical protein